ncbi:MAG: L-2-amino-thiazoline-4-carboxylic acid hydrolase [Alphaproteobacteria bacterium]|jgi:hypothetical protein|nr:2-amino-thiazoline-4-carboxylic acid hydrolase [Rhodospirillaceae bacterium]MDP6404608.1 L-2-amino-thiazoline-4-carboxylic acid hydrolase [Alphaproteobacteria bacterium]MDP6621377.1 L-2-amino-thiazoline-4-carboxylic acid hydrolase [Alphaproteobacteria bacterium]|tara:strand:+ start:335 stop:796 length:462 start_codon:yes stop_codon:yes gene_type:complete
MAESKFTQFDHFKSQMTLLVPLVRRLREELGEAAADDLVGEVLDAKARAQGERLAAAGRGDRHGMQRIFEAFAADGALEYQTLGEGETELCFDVQRCVYAEHLEKLGARDLGPLLACRVDGPMAEGMGIDFERSQTLMAGGPCCDFRYRFGAD